MQLMMYLANDLIEAYPLDRTQISIPGYLGKIKRELKEKHALILQTSTTPPDFLVIAGSSQEDHSRLEEF